MPRQTEPNANNALGDLLRSMMPRWQVRSENTQTFPNHPGRHADVLITAPGSSPVVVEGEYEPAPEVEKDAFDRLGLAVQGEPRTIEAAIALRYPIAVEEAYDVREAVAAARFAYCVLHEDGSRFPESGWLNGSASDLADLIRLISVPQKAVELAAGILERGIGQAANRLEEMAKLRPNVTPVIARLLGMKDVPQTRRMACAIIANAMVFHQRIAGMHDGVKPLRLVCGPDITNPQEETLSAWAAILKINYWPIFAIAKDLLEQLPGNTAASILRELLETAQGVEATGVDNHFYVAEGTSPTPPSVPATDTPTIKTDLSSEGLLEAGWPLVNMASLKFEFRGVEYSYVDHSHFGGYVQIEELETLVIDYNVDVGRLPSPALEEIATGATVQDRIRIYRLPNRPVNEVILVDQCPGDLHGHQFVYYQQTGLHRKHTSEAPKLATTPTPEPMQPGTKRTMPPEYVRLDLDPKVVVAFVDDDDLGRIVYVTHVPSGAQVVLDAESNVLEKHFGSTAGDRALNMALRDADVMERIRRGLQYDGDIPGNAIMDWVNFIHFGGHEYLSNAMRGEGDEVDESRLGEVLYRVAFHVDANLMPGDYRPRDGDAAFLPPGTAIRSVDGYSPSEVLAAVVEGEVWLFKRSVPGPSTPTPVVVPRSP